MNEIASFGQITAEELHEKMRSGQQVDLIDVRTPVEFREVHATIARNAPLDALDPVKIMQSRNGSRAKPLYVICNSGGRSTKACEKLVAAGFTNIINVEGGTKGWAAAGLPVHRGKKAVSIERQVRIAAGLLVLTGSVLGYFVHPAWIGLSAFVGAGLTFAGITDTCAMGMMIAKMPWNQLSGKQQCSV